MKRRLQLLQKTWPQLRAVSRGCVMQMEHWLASFASFIRAARMALLTFESASVMAVE